MRVLFVTRKYPPMVGGMEAQSYQLTSRFPAPKRIISLGRSQKHLVWFLPYVLVRAWLEADTYDVLHLGDGLLAAVGLAPRYLAGKRVVVTVHGLDLTFRSRLYQTYLKLCLRPHQALPVSESTRRIAKERGLCAPYSIPVGVTEPFFDIPRDPGADAELNAQRAGRTILLTIGRLVPRKGVAWFIRNVLPKLSGVLYVVVGDGPDASAVREAIRSSGTEQSVLLLGRISAERLRSVISAADIFVMPNISVPGDVEGFGIVAIEAAASGLPVVASRLEGIPDAIIDGKNGDLVNPGEPDAFVAALTPLLQQPRLRAQRGDAARQFTRETYAWPRVVERYVQALSEQLSPDARPRE
ncbi:MAG TPA: glycosyltransferase family 4 protein [Polyangiaceae bacterium]|nr:glycosyltransferase family 4 protein [Polyangiaceae bacterium]